jgi:predicted DNA-binding transcriptional regulator AlpA
MSDRLLDIEDLANRLKIPAKTIRNKLSNGTWPISPVRIGRALRWRESDVATAIAGLSSGSSGRENSRVGRGR